jgi:methyl-branched lipid omega-hydroxylase
MGNRIEFGSEGGEAVMPDQAPGTAGSPVTPDTPPRSPATSLALDNIDLSDIDLSDRAFWGRPPADRQAAFALLRAREHPAFFAEPQSPFAEQGPGYFALVRHADVAEASRNPEVFCSRRGATSIIDLPAEFNEYFGSMINMDDPRHGRLRRIVSRAFTPRMIGKFEEDVARVATRIVDDLLESGPCDFVESVAARLPLTVICQMMGVPESSYDMVLRNTNIILSGTDPDFLSEDMGEAVGQILSAGQELAGLVTGLAAMRADRPADDLVSSLVTANIDGEQLTGAELASFFVLLVVAGNETTRTAISHSLMLLTEHPAQRALLLDTFEDRIGGAVEEIVRYASPVMFMRRTVTRDCTMNGHAYREGDKTVLFYWSANRDEAVFTDSDTFDVTRSPNPHVGFGAAGPHFCLGAHLARREITVMLRELLGRIPDVSAAGPPARLLSSFINGIKHLPCEFSR